MILMIDNYDSFTYNLVQYLMMLGEEVLVKRNDEISLEEIHDLRPEMIVLSPGPCTPKEAGICPLVAQSLYQAYPILGICLGHQTIAAAFGGQIIKGKAPVHGKVHGILHNNKGVFEGLNNPLQVTRYHSLVVDPASLPECFEITSTTPAGEIMGIRHRDYPIEGVQFHPEAILTEQGLELLSNFLQSARRWRQSHAEKED